MVFPWWAQAAALCWAGHCLPARVLQPGMKMVEREGEKAETKAGFALRGCGHPCKHELGADAWAPPASSASRRAAGFCGALKILQQMKRAVVSFCSQLLKNFGLIKGAAVPAQKLPCLYLKHGRSMCMCVTWCPAPLCKVVLREPSAALTSVCLTPQDCAQVHETE